MMILFHLPIRLRLYHHHHYYHFHLYHLYHYHLYHILPLLLLVLLPPEPTETISSPHRPVDQPVLMPYQLQQSVYHQQHQQQPWQGGYTKRLYNEIFHERDYNKIIRPVGKETDTLVVKLGLRLVSITDIDEKNQIMTTGVWLEQEWFDYKLSWNPPDFGEVRKIYVPAENIWRPDIVLYNSADGNFTVKTMTKATVHYTGLVVWNPPAIYKSLCLIDVEYFPFDEQMCTLKMGSWSYDGHSVDIKHNQLTDSDNELSTVPEGINLTQYSPSTEWDLLSVTAQKYLKTYPCCSEPFPDIKFNITIRRKTLYHTVNLILPCVAICGVTLLVFFIPAYSGEKITMAITILNSLNIFLLLVAEINPPTSLATPLIGKYLLFTMVLVTCSIIVTVFVLNVHFRSPSTHVMSPWVARLFLRLLPRLLFMQRPQERRRELQRKLGIGSVLGGINCGDGNRTTQKPLLNNGGRLNPGVSGVRRDASNHHKSANVTTSFTEQPPLPRRSRAFGSENSAADDKSKTAEPSDNKNRKYYHQDPFSDYQPRYSTTITTTTATITTTTNPDTENNRLGATKHEKNGIRDGGDFFFAGISSSSVEKNPAKATANYSSSSPERGKAVWESLRNCDAPYYVCTIPPPLSAFATALKTSGLSVSNSAAAAVAGSDDECPPPKGKRAERTGIGWVNYEGEFGSGAIRVEGEEEEESRMGGGMGSRRGGSRRRRRGVVDRSEGDSIGKGNKIAENGKWSRESRRGKLPPAVFQAVVGVNYIAQHLREQDAFNRVKEDWQFIAMVMDRLFMWMFTAVCLVGTFGIIIQAPALYDTRTPLG